MILIPKSLDKQSTWEANIRKIKAGSTKTMAPRDPDTVDIIELFSYPLRMKTGMFKKF